MVHASHSTSVHTRRYKHRYMSLFFTACITAACCMHDRRDCWACPVCGRVLVRTRLSGWVVLVGRGLASLGARTPCAQGVRAPLAAAAAPQIMLNKPNVP